MMNPQLKAVVAWRREVERKRKANLKGPKSNRGRKPTGRNPPAPKLYNETGNRIWVGGAHSGSRTPGSRLERSYEVLTRHGVPDKDLRKYRNEWLSGRSLTHHHCGQAVDFVAWLNRRLSDKYHACKKVETAVKKACGETGLRQFKALWRRQVALAKVMRTSPNVRIALLADKWLEAVREDIIAMAIDITRRGITPGWRPEACEHLQPTEILTSDCPRMVKPLWLKASEEMFQLNLPQMSQEEFMARLKRVYAEAKADIAAAAGHRNAIIVSNFSIDCGGLSWLFPVMRVAVRLGLSAGDLLASEKAYLDAVRGGDHLPLTTANPWGDFLTWLRSNAVRERPLRGPARNKRLKDINSIPGGWFINVPTEAKRMARQLELPSVSYLEEVENMAIPPADAHLGYFMFLIKETARIERSPYRKRSRKKSDDCYAATKGARHMYSHMGGNFSKSPDAATFIAEIEADRAAMAEDFRRRHPERDHPPPEETVYEIIPAKVSIQNTRVLRRSKRGHGERGESIEAFVADVEAIRAQQDEAWRRNPGSCRQPPKVPNFIEFVSAN